MFILALRCAVLAFQLNREGLIICEKKRAQTRDFFASGFE